MKSFYPLFLLFICFSSLAQSSFLQQPEARPIANRSMLVPITATISYQGYDESQAYFGEGEYEIFIDNIDGILDKPIILTDGFDPRDTRDIGSIYNSLTFGPDNIADILRDEGFDIVILNAPQYITNAKAIDGGSDYIQRNALVMIELINLINAQKVGSEELVVIGPSMGGLITQYALSYMEQNSMNHETRLFISFDTPHRGANIPISLQYLINYLAEVAGDPDAQAIVNNVLNSPAAQEMLYDHYSAHLMAGSTYEQDPNILLPIGATNFRDTFQAELDALGFPQQTRNVAMVNGSGTSTTTGTPGIQVVDTTLDFGAGVTTDVLLRFVPVASQTNTVTDVTSYLFGIPVGTYAADAESFPFTDGVDSSPGGQSSISEALGGGTSSNPVVIAFLAALEQDEFSFIPAISSLAIDNEDDWYAAPDIGGIHTSPFVNTFIPSENEFHITVTAASAQFALDEIRDGALGIGDQNLSNKYVLNQNPVSSEIVLTLNAAFNYTSVNTAVYNVVGQKLLRQEFQNPSEAISINHNLGSGIYLLVVKDSEGSQTIKFIVN